ncbi:MAG: LacI family DNA-binding transcriptional regulator [Spirochaetia bacterium]
MAGIKDIAEQANVSIGTVDRVIHNRGGVAQKTIQRVREVMEALDYRPDIHASNLSSRKVYRFGVVFPEPSQDSGFWSEPANGVRSAMSELERHRVQAEFYNYDEWDISSFVQSLDRALTDGVSGLLIAASTITGKAAVFRRIPGDVPYVICDSYIPGTECITYVGENSYQAGRTAGRLMSDMVPHGAVAALRSLPGTVHIDRRVSGFVDAVGERNPVSPLRLDFDSTMSERQIDVFVRDLFADYPKLAGVFVSNASINRLAPSFRRHAREHRPRLIGFDIIPENRALLKSETVDYLIGQRPEEQTYLGMHILYAHMVLNQRFPPRVIVPIDVVCSENVEEYSPRLAVEQYALES